MSANTLAFLLTTMRLFKEAALPVWVFGGWAEELWQITRPKAHNDIDFLYSAATFDGLDSMMTQIKDMQELQQKRFSHKRAIIYQHVMIEFLLVQRAKGIYITDFFSGRFRLEWPADVFCHKKSISRYTIPIASKQALNIYRQRHKQIQQAYQEFLQVTG